VVVRSACPVPVKPGRSTMADDAVRGADPELFELIGLAPGAADELVQAPGVEPRRCLPEPAAYASRPPPEEVDITNAGALRAALLRAGAQGRKTYVVDMTRTRFCDSAGLTRCSVPIGAPRLKAARSGSSSPVRASAGSWPSWPSTG
jgi:hypothetical protein